MSRYQSGTALAITATTLATVLRIAGMHARDRARE